ncbi:MAG: hypothetical protein ACYCSQ_00820 [bacterium]
MFKKSAKTEQLVAQVKDKNKGPIQEYIKYQQDYIKHQPRRVKIFAFVFFMFTFIGFLFIFLSITGDINFNPQYIPKPIQLPKHLIKQESSQLNQMKILSNKLKKEIAMQEK